MTTVQQAVAALATMTVGQLRARYRDVFGEETKATNKAWLRKRVAWRIQAVAEGGLSDRAQRRADELANDADLRVCVPAGHPVLALVEPGADGPAGEPNAAASPQVQGGPRLHRPQQAEPAPVVPQPHDDRLPPIGTVLTRTYKGAVLKVTVLADGFEYEGEKYQSLSAVAKAVTGSHCNGFAFFHLKGTKAKEAK